MLNILGDGWKSNTRLLMIAFAVSGTLGLAVVFAHAAAAGSEVKQAATPYLWAFACMSVGSLVGFLFGIPRTTDRDTVPVSMLAPRSPGAPPGPAPTATGANPAVPNPANPNPAAPNVAAHVPGEPANPANVPAVPQPPVAEPPGSGGPRSHVNTNLEQVSDWLTKIIVGVGLTQLQHIPAAIQSVARTLSRALDPSPGDAYLAFAEALVVYFTIIGFIYAYLLTRVYLQKVFDGPQPKQASHDGGISHTNIVVAQ